MDQLVTREGELFQVSDTAGDFHPAETVYGLFARDTRYLSRFELIVNGAKPRLLTARANENYIQRVFAGAGESHEALSQHLSLGVQRLRVLHGGVMYERISLTNYALTSLDARIELRVEADFADLFELRGLPRPQHGAPLPATIEADRLVLGYRGLDDVTRQTELRFSHPPDELEATRVLWHMTLAPQQSMIFDVAVLPVESGHVPAIVGYDTALAALAGSYAGWHEQCTAIDSDSELLNAVLERSLLDLRLLLDDRGQGLFCVAGVPWFAAPFGRDSLIVAIQTLALRPALARGALRTMAALQGRVVDPWRGEEPGKIPHELRRGEMTNLGEVPFGRYYGSVDSTPLFLVLLCEYYAWSADLDLVRELLPHVRAAVEWLDSYGDRDGDGLLEFQADPGKGLAVQSWKDSSISLSHRDGTVAAGPVAVCEAQGYAYDARRKLAPLMAQVGETALAERLVRDAEKLKESFNRRFWMEDRQYLAIALDGAKAQVGTVASDAGHCLWSGIVETVHAEAVARRLLAPDLFSGWGIRTLSMQEATYNPMSYHNGSVWPHDNSLCVLGLKRYGYDQEANTVATALIEAAAHFGYARLPELFCGYSRAEGPPVDYPVACSPQAWAAATPIALVQSILGLHPDAAAGVLRLRPCLPSWLGRLRLHGLRVGSAVLDLEVTPAGAQATVREGTLQVIVEPAGPGEGLAR